MKSIFLVIFRPGSGWLPGKPLAEQPLGEHVKHHLGLYEKGIVKFAGPFTDDTGGAAVMEASSLEEINGMICYKKCGKMWTPHFSSCFTVRNLH